MNVTSAAIMLIGGSLWAFDISTIADLRQRVRGGMGIDEQEVEEDFEEWIASTLARKERKDAAKESVVEAVKRQNDTDGKR